MATAHGWSDLAGQARPAAIKAIDQLLALDMVPRLLVAHGQERARIAGSAPAFEPRHVERLAELSIELEAHRLLELIESFLDRGLSAETLFVELLAPAARHLGRGWEDDRLDFVDVTMGLWRLQEVLRDVASRAPRSGSELTRGSALFAPFPGDQHNFGTAMIQECFGLAGWDAEMLVDPSTIELLDHVAGTALDLLGLTLSCDAHIERLPALIRAVRSVSMNPHIRILVGGRACNAHGGIAALVGADGTAANAPDAVVLAERLVRAARAVAA
jgi:methanogenic corrinoid protein MtbC1